MFIDEEWKKHSPNEVPVAEEKKDKKYLYFAVLAVVFISAIIFVLWYYLNPPSGGGGGQLTRPSQKASTTGLITLPGDLGGNGNKNGEGYLPDDLKAEDLRFGSFYKEPKEISLPTIESFSLPMNIKADVLNYYDISRKVNIDKQVDLINANAFSFLDEQYNSSDSDFFSVNRDLLENGVPLLITTDFISYYNQNILKTVYQEIEKSVFYENLWDISKKLYDISLARYRRDVSKSGVVNDPVIEGERLETAYLAVILKLLKPKDDQINQDDNFLDDNLFSKEESQIYYFDIPRELQREIDAEIKLIYLAQEVAKSPVFLYERDYQEYKVPINYSKNAKLKNYYLAKKWMSTVFPMFYKSEDCPDCLLDYNDWMNNFSAASFLSEDLKNNQDIKNRWAAIYKFIAFFEGLRSDLTYLHINDAFSKEFDDSYTIENIFSNANDKRKENLEALRQHLLSVNFLPLEGVISREGNKTKPLVGVRLLQNNYWPNDYIFSKLTGESMITDRKLKTNEILTSCLLSEGKSYRCAGFSGDILSLHDIFPQKNSEYQKEIDYQGYESNVQSLKNQLDKFDNDAWNSNVYWINYNTTQNLIDYSKKTLDTLSLNQNWEEEKIVNYVLGSWVNASIPVDAWENYQTSKSNTLGFAIECNLNSYVEPNLFFYSDLIERNKMLLRAVEILRVGKKTNAASILLTELNKDLLELQKIVQKEIKGERINEEECRVLEEIAGGSSVIVEAPKYISLGNERTGIKELIKGVNLLALVYQIANDEKIMVVGPVYNYKEGKFKTLR